MVRAVSLSLSQGCFGGLQKFFSRSFSAPLPLTTKDAPILCVLTISYINPGHTILVNSSFFLLISPGGLSNKTQ